VSCGKLASAAIDRLTLDKGRLEQETKGLTAELGQKRQELARLVQTKEREGQVFLLSTDTEIVGRYLRLIEPRLAKAYHLTHEHDGHVGRCSSGSAIRGPRSEPIGR
jgi:hypothetical protein